ncbi:type VI secretion system baseplate subunit TssG, partial [Enterobacter sp. PTB]
RVYLGYRSDVRLQLRVPLSLIPEPRLRREHRVRLGQTGVLGHQGRETSASREITVSTGRYEGLSVAVLPPAQYGQYRFEQETP